MIRLRPPIAVLCLAGALFVFTSGPPATAASQVASGTGVELYEARCASCHASDGTGTDRGPSIVDAGAASADFVLATGRMPADESGAQAARRPPQFDAADRAALVEFVASLGDGPPIPEIDMSEADPVAGGVIFREQCAACHQAGAAGAALSDGLAAPALGAATAQEILEAMTIGPGAMPVFSALDDRQKADVAAYVRAIDSAPDPGGFSLGRVGPVAEGAVAWFLGLGVLVVIARWIGSTDRGRDA